MRTWFCFSRNYFQSFVEIQHYTTVALNTINRYEYINWTLYLGSSFFEKCWKNVVSQMYFQNHYSKIKSWLTEWIDNRVNAHLLTWFIKWTIQFVYRLNETKYEFLMNDLLFVIQLDLMKQVVFARSCLS